MKPLTKLGEAVDTQGSTWELWERDGVLSLLQDGTQCASSFTHGSDDAMADVALAPIERATQPIIMFAGLGLGYALAMTADGIRRDKAKFIVAEPVPAIVEWNKKYGENAPMMVNDPRIEIEYSSAADLCRKRSGSLHAIMINHTHGKFDLSVADAQAYFNALKGGSMLVIAIGRTDRRLETTLRRAGFHVDFTHVAAASKGKQMRQHTLLMALRGRFVSFAARGEEAKSEEARGEEAKSEG